MVEHGRPGGQRYLHKRKFATLFEIEKAHAEARAERKGIRQDFFDERRHDAWARKFSERVDFGKVFYSEETPGGGWYASTLARERRWSIHVVCADLTIDTIGWLKYETLEQARTEAAAMFGRQDTLL